MGWGGTFKWGGGEPLSGVERESWSWMGLRLLEWGGKVFFELGGVHCGFFEWG